ncbi:ABC transporter substrate-binding protein [Cohnella sp. WQ 127256]|uniref:ABC transporter substrate-binding protein n=1 Tax=Cohnella sp. WQ 127256 TaxID=2938790 RepID=UPI002118B284|nr:ABC transporter substrate-binding protein [Cohnella sp. WQ 127256]
MKSQSQTVRKGQKGLIVLSFVLMTGLLAGCGGKENETKVGAESSAPASSSAVSSEPVELRMNVVSTGTQSIPSFLIQKLELDKKHGFVLKAVEDSGAVNANWTAFKTGQVDGMITDWLSLARNIEQGEKVKAVVPFLGWGNGILVPDDSAVQSVKDLKDLNIGVYSRISPDWVLIRAAAKKLYDLDVEKTNKVSEAAPGLLLGLMQEKKLDVALNYGDLNNRLAGPGGYRIPFYVSDVLVDLGLSPEAPFLFYAFSDSFIEEHPDTVKAFAAAYKEAIEYLNSDSEIWNEIAKKMDITDAKTIELIKDGAKKNIFLELTPNMEGNIQKIFEVLKAETGKDELGFESIPEQMIWQP